MRPLIGWLMALTVFVAMPGCAGTRGVRYVYQDGEFGVVGIPENTDRWPTHYRRQAEGLMAAHFPEGHDIVRAEEVVEGSRTLTVQGTKTAELMPQLSAPLLQVGKLGRSASRSQADTLKIKECRIVYRRSPRPTTTAAYTELASLSPTQYLDPNDAERRKITRDTPGAEKPDQKNETKLAQPSSGTSAPGKPERSGSNEVLSKASITPE